MYLCLSKEVSIANTRHAIHRLTLLGHSEDISSETLTRIYLHPAILRDQFIRYRYPLKYGDPLLDNSIVLHAKYTVIEFSGLLKNGTAMERLRVHWTYLDMLSIRSILVIPSQCKIWRATLLALTIIHTPAKTNVGHKCLESHVLPVSE